VVVNDVVTEVRRLISDTRTPYRYSDAELVGYVNQTLKRMAIMRPDLFSYIGEMLCDTGTTLQSIPEDGIRVVEVFNVVGGKSLVEVDRESLDQMYPQWANDAAKPAQNWMRHPRNPTKFFIYPKAPANQYLTIEYAKTPATYGLGDTVLLLSDSYFPTVVDGTVFLAESIDDEHVTSGRAKMFQDSFLQGLSASAAAREATDSEDANMAPANRDRRLRENRTNMKMR